MLSRAWRRRRRCRSVDVDVVVHLTSFVDGVGVVVVISTSIINTFVISHRAIKEVRRGGGGEEEAQSSHLHLMPG